MSIFVTGDTHGSKQLGPFSIDGFQHRFNTKSFPEQKGLTKEDFVIICGDFGGVWNYMGETKEEKAALDWLDNKPFTTLFVPGNHENYDRLTGLENPNLLGSWIFKKLSKEEKEKIKLGYPQKLWHNGVVREIRPSVLMLERGYVFDICGKKCFAFGGANSHDIHEGVLKTEDFETEAEANEEYEEWSLVKRHFRVSHISWWEQEMPLQMEMERGFSLLEDERNKVDFIFTHDAPASVKRMLLGAGADKLNRYFERIKQSVDYKLWFFGHYHDNKVMPGGKDILVYEQIIQIC